METVNDWDAAEFIDTKEDVIAYLETTMNENDPALLLKAIDAIARSEGMARIAGELNLDPENLYKSFPAKDPPSFITVVKVLDNLGFQLSIQQKKAS
ncbi:MAG: putative addiction module antidote protein [Spirochaetaceae bacterium]|jgi:probable addiction module antidote protein|nr:putative addiction module antidote protein [Spirochaetaceae bacterium]